MSEGMGDVTQSVTGPHVQFISNLSGSLTAVGLAGQHHMQLISGGVRRNDDQIPPHVGAQVPSTSSSSGSTSWLSPAKALAFVSLTTLR
jgi:hypothetical protein